MKAADLTSVRTRVRIHSCTEEEVGDSKELKPVLQFTGTKLKPLVVNFTNLVMLCDAFGPDEETWLGKIIVLVKTKAIFQGRSVDAIRIEIPPQAVAAPAPPVSEPEPMPEEIPTQDEAELI